MRKLRTPVSMMAAVMVLAALVVATWWLFLGRDTTYQRDSSGQMSGPYEAPQILWCVVVLALLAAAGTLLLPDWAVIGTVSLAFTAAWSINASSKDVTGLWPVGAIGVLLGSSCLAGLVAFLIDKARTQHQVRP